MPEHKTDVETAKAVIALADAGGKLPKDAPCCAYSGGVEMDVEMSPESPAKMFKRGRGCPLSIVAYSIQRGRQDGKDVDVVAQKRGAPYLRLDGKVVDPLQHYSNENCGCPP